ncbi:hypothetical protein SLS62_008253 [Diatrype stigma]|uniref:DUF6546 domain-containing protein n=1 Tax=Diatrype stigma TaxID=117547 RepID=A0AAN9YP47_9PEZI
MPPRLRSYRETSFWALPQELRLQVWEFIMETGAPYSGYASVSRGWQSFFERLTFKTLRLHQDDIPNFTKIVKGHRTSFVRHIWLRLELLGYDCPNCEEPESEAERKSNNQIFSVAVYRLFSILGEWEKGVTGGLEIELSAHSRSDWEHHFKELAYRSTEGATRPLPGSVRYHDPAHDGGIKRIIEALPNLEHFSYEPWAGGMFDREIKRWEYDHTYLASKLLQRKRSLKTVSIFQDFNRPLNGQCAARFPVGKWGPEFAELSVSLERMYGSFAVDAMDFFAYVDEHVSEEEKVRQTAFVCRSSRSEHA